jgi:hypothetical protein
MESGAVKLDREALRAANRLEDVIPALTGHPLSRNGTRELTARCAWHGDGDDQHPSLRIDVEKQQWFCDVCRDGGDVFKYVMRHQQTDFKGAMAWCAQRAGLAPHPQSRIVATFDYCALDGHLVYQSCRKEPGPNGKKKTYVQRRPDGQGAWIYDTKGVELVPYRLPDLQGKAAAFITEGERKTDRLWALGLPATCNVGGAGKWKPEYATRLFEVGVRRVAILGDNDPPGYNHAEDVARSCHAAGLHVRVVELPNLPTKGDVIDWLDAGHTRDELVKLARETSEWTPPVLPAEPTTTATSEQEPTGNPPKKNTGKKGAAGRTLQLEEPSPWPTPVDGEQLLNDTVGVIQQYVVLSAAQADTGALWIGATHAIDALTRMPMLLLSSPTPECGKTTAATCFSGLVPRPVMVASLTPAVLFRLLDKYQPTLIADEVDSWLNDEKSELRGIFNAAHWRSGAAVPRCVGESHEVRLFNVFGAKLLAMIGWPPTTMRSRSIAIRLRRKTPAENVEHLRDERVREEFAPLRRRWSRWALDHLDAIRVSDPHMPTGLPINRASDNWRPLLAVADLAGGTWPDRARAAALALSGVRVAEDEPEAALLLGDVQTVFREASDPVYLSSEEIIAALKALPERPWADWNKGRGISPAQLAKRLRDFGFGPLGLRTRETRLTSMKTAKRWHRDDFADAWARFLVDTPSDLTVNPQHPQQPNEFGLKVEISDPQHEPSVAGSKNAISSMFTESVAGVAGSRPDQAGDVDIQAPMKVPTPAAALTEREAGEL